MMGYIWLAIAAVSLLIHCYVSIARKAGSFRWNDIMEYESDSPLDELGVGLIFTIAIWVIGSALCVALYCIFSFVKFLNQWTF